MHEDRAAVDMNVELQLLSEQFHVPGSIHSGVRRKEVQSSSDTIRHGNSNHLAWRLFHCGCMFLVKTLSQWPPNVHVARYKLLHGAFVRKHHCLPLKESPMTMTSGKVQYLFTVKKMC